MNSYFKPILLFGVVLPTILFGLIFYFGSKKVRQNKAELDNKITLQNQNNLTRNQANSLAQQIKLNQPRFESWNTLLESEASTTIMGSLKDSTEEFSGILSQSSFSRSRTTTSFASRVPKPSTAWDFNLRGTFQTIQKAYYKLESQNPQLFLERFELRPDEVNQSLSTTATYSAWTLDN